MARKGETNGNASGHIKFRVIEFEIDGGNDTLAEGIKALTTALSKSPVVLTPATRPALPSGSKSKASSTAVAEPSPSEETAHTEQEPEDVMEPGAEADEEAGGNGKTSRKQRSAPRAPKFLSELNLTTASVKLADFMTEKKNPTSTLDKYLVIAEWFKEYMQLPEITVDHIYTAYDHLGWKSQVPNYPNQPLVDLKLKNLLDKGDKRGGYKINWNGTSAVAKMGTE